ncbi:MAG: cytochrome c-type biogenesis protein CcmH [Bosea sp. (in: a-proteobacteria)]|nr:MAG: cytochrome c-type biogenesis protein CcmH [Bosea sp. (in: a-proteobacteria)]
MRRLLAVLLLALPVLASAQPPDDAPPKTVEATLDAEQQERYRRLVHELRCLVCQNQTISDSNAPLAQDLRAQVERQISEGRSDDEIRKYMTERYGDFVLYKPPVQNNTLVLWAGPFLLLLGALAVALRQLLRRRAVAEPAPPPNPQALQKLLDEDRP